MIEKFFGGCQSEKNKINEIIDAVNGLEGGSGGGSAGVTISDVDASNLTSQYVTDDTKTAIQIDIDDYRIVFIEQVGTIGQVGPIGPIGDSLRVLGFTNSYLKGYETITFNVNCTIYKDTSALLPINPCDFYINYFYIYGVEETSVGDNIVVAGYVIFRKTGD